MEKRILKTVKNKISDLAELISETVSSPAARYVIKRIIFAILTILAVITVTFFLMHAVPGGPFAAEKALTPEAEAALREKYGLDKPLFVQYITYLSDVIFRLDFGPSLTSRGRDVATIIGDGLSVSARLGIFAAALALLLGILLGTLAAAKHGRWQDRIIMLVTTAFVSMPSFIMGTLLLLIFSLKAGWLPAVADEGVLGYILPTITLALYPTAYIARLTRSSMLETLSQDYIRTARAKGLSWREVTLRHALKNSLLPVITYIGPMIAGIVTGSLVVERIFAVPGIGREFVGSITGRDYPLIMGTTIVLAALVVFMNLISDLLYRAADPRITLYE